MSGAHGQYVHLQQMQEAIKAERDKEVANIGLAKMFI